MKKTNYEVTPFNAFLATDLEKRLLSLIAKSIEENGGEKSGQFTQKALSELLSRKDKTIEQSIFRMRKKGWILRSEAGDSRKGNGGFACFRLLESIQTAILSYDEIVSQKLNVHTMTTTENKILSVLVLECQKKGTEATDLISSRALSGITGMTMEAIRQSVRKMRDKGWILPLVEGDSLGGDHGGTIYRLPKTTMDAMVVRSPATQPDDTNQIPDGKFSLNLVIPTDLLQKLRVISFLEERDLSGEIAYILRHYVSSFNIPESSGPGLTALEAAAERKLTTEAEEKFRMMHIHFS